MRSFSAILIAIAVMLFGTNLILADQPLVGEGTEGIADLKGRNPVVSVSTLVTDGNVKLLADAYTRDQKYTDYPIRFDFYVNRTLHTSQIRSKSLPGPVGIDIGPDIATLPFNYSVLATVITPNRQFSTLIQGAVFEEALPTELDCSLTILENEETELFVANAVEVSQATQDAWVFGFAANSTDNTETISLGVSIIAEDLSATGTITLERDDQSEVADVVGTIERQNGAVTSLNLANADSSLRLICN